MGQTKTITIPAAANGVAGVVVDAGTNYFFHCISATAAFRAQPDNQASSAVDAGIGFGSPPVVEQYRNFTGTHTRTSGGWTSLVFYNDSATPIVATYYVGDTQYVGQTQSVVTSTVTTSGKDASSYTKATSCPANATTTFNGLDGALVRKQFAVWNNEASGGANIGIADNGGTVGFYVGPQSGFTMPSNGVFKVVVPAGAQAAKVLETFYST